jgi:hypothetical protein
MHLYKYQSLFFFGKVSLMQGIASQKVLLDLRGDFVIQLHPDSKDIICGFRCDYTINFEIIRTTPQVQLLTLRTTSA